MPASALVLLIIPGKIDAWRELMAQCNDDNPDYVDSRQRLGITREQVFLHGNVGSSRVDLQACKLEYSIVSPK